MGYSKIKNGKKISVGKYSSVVKISDPDTGEVEAYKNFTCHIKAVMVAKAL